MKITTTSAALLHSLWVNLALIACCVASIAINLEQPDTSPLEGKLQQIIELLEDKSEITTDLTREVKALTSKQPLTYDDIAGTVRVKVR